jgi:hypothetical protein
VPHKNPETPQSFIGRYLWIIFPLHSAHLISSFKHLPVFDFYIKIMIIFCVGKKFVK